MNPTPIDPTQKMTPTAKTKMNETKNNVQSDIQTHLPASNKVQTRAQKLDHIRLQIAQGAYLVSAEELAKKLVDGGFLG